MSAILQKTIDLCWSAALFPLLPKGKNAARPRLQPAAAGTGKTISRRNQSTLMPPRSISANLLFITRTAIQGAGG